MRYSVTYSSERRQWHNKWTGEVPASQEACCRTREADAWVEGADGAGQSQQEGNQQEAPHLLKMLVEGATAVIWAGVQAGEVWGCRAGW